MKINPLTGAVHFLNSVREKREEQGGNRQQQRHEQKKDESESFEKALEVSQEKVDQAVQAFQAEAGARASGLHVATQGTGPGLRVVLTDSQGTVVRQLTGEEFLRLREAASATPHARGKILDQKL